MQRIQESKKMFFLGGGGVVNTHTNIYIYVYVYIYEYNNININIYIYIETYMFIARLRVVGEKDRGQQII